MSTPLLSLSYTNEDILELEDLMRGTENQFLKQSLIQVISGIQSSLINDAEHVVPSPTEKTKKPNLQQMVFTTIANYSWADFRNDAIKYV
jgi:hypothetical protein